MLRLFVSVCFSEPFSAAVYPDDLWEQQMNNNPRLFNILKVDKSGTIWTGNRKGIKKDCEKIELGGVPDFPSTHPWPPLFSKG